MRAAGYKFRPMQAVDLPLVQRLLATPQVARWWGDPDEQYALVSEDLRQPSMEQFIVARDDRLFAYLQCYDPAAWPNNGFGAQPAGGLGIDQFIGEVDMIDCGHGSALIGAFTDGLLAAGTPCVVTDPDLENARAIRSYEKAGFRKAHLVETPEGTALLMVRSA